MIGCSHNGIVHSLSGSVTDSVVAGKRRGGVRRDDALEWILRVGDVAPEPYVSVGLMNA